MNFCRLFSHCRAVQRPESFCFAKEWEMRIWPLSPQTDFPAGLDTTLLLHRKQHVLSASERLHVSEIRHTHPLIPQRRCIPICTMPAWASYRKGRYSVPCREGGRQCGQPHHNDTGSVTVYKKRSPLLIDVGVESYTKKTFSSRRYEIWTMQSRYHICPP